ncbi:hypothetical protein ACIOWF_06800 [Cellulosimicrobium cellulans]|uniref:terminase small subunit n=1 Tax=Cellulosimicrobium cellulans TaxID=1710 RepID=UPI00382DD639
MSRNDKTYEKRQKVLELRRAGMTFDEIARRVGYANRGGARKAYEAALADAGVSPTTEQTRALELDRLDRLQTALWARAVRGDLAVIDRVLKISEHRMRLEARPEGNDHAMRTALERTVEKSELIDKDVDAALIEAGMKIADRIDESVSLGEGSDATRVLYLVPHFVNILRELLATPAVRSGLTPVSGGKGAKSGGADGKGGGPGKVSKFSEAAEQRRRRQQAGGTAAG